MAHVLSPLVLACQRLGLATHVIPSHPLRVLIVDDEEAVCQYVTRVLREAGCIVETATSGPEALERVQTFSGIDLLLTDLVMPKMSGDELARRLRTSEPDLPVLFLTGFSDRLFAEQALLWDREAFLDKPCTARGLVEAVALITAARLSKGSLVACHA